MLEWITKIATLIAAISAAYFAFRTYKLQRDGRKIDLIVKDEEKIRDKMVEFMGLAHEKMIIVMKKEDDNDLIDDEELSIDGKMFQIYTYLMTVLDDSDPEIHRVFRDLQSIIDARRKDNLAPGLVMKCARIITNQQKRAVINIMNRL